MHTNQRGTCPALPNPPSTSHTTAAPHTHHSASIDTVHHNGNQCQWNYCYQRITSKIIITIYHHHHRQDAAPLLPLCECNTCRRPPPCNNNSAAAAAAAPPSEGELLFLNISFLVEILRHSTSSWRERESNWYYIMTWWLVNFDPYYLLTTPRPVHRPDSKTGVKSRSDKGVNKSPFICRRAESPETGSSTQERVVEGGWVY